MINHLSVDGDFELNINICDYVIRRLPNTDKFSIFITIATPHPVSSVLCKFPRMNDSVKFALDKAWLCSNA